MKVSKAIILAVLVPTFVAIFFSATLITEEISVSHDIGQLHILSELSVKMSNLVHEQQKERGATAVFVGSNGQRFSSELRAQRENTNKKREELNKFTSDFDSELYGRVFQSKYNDLFEELEKLDNIRSRVDELSVSAKEAIGFYTGLNAKNLNLIAHMANVSLNPEVVIAIVGYSNFLQGKERAGIERAVGANAFAGGKFTLAAMDKFKSLISTQDTYNHIFLSYATEEQKNIYDEVMDSNASKDVDRMRAIAFDGGLAGDLQGISGKYWFDTITKKINGLKKIEDSLSVDLLKKMENIKHYSDSKLIKELIIVVVSLFATIILSTLIIRILTNSFGGVATAMTEIANGNLDIELPERTANEMGKMVDALIIFKDNALETERLKSEQEEAAKHAEEEKRQLMSNLADDFETNVSGFITSMTASSDDLQATAGTMKTLADETGKASESVVKSSEESSESVNMVAAAMEEMSASSAEIASQISLAKDKSNDTAENANEANNTVENLSELVSNIGEVVVAIQDIAEQTNLLALNATIEAARAGDAGRGFAVVADEVKKLATETSAKTGEINSRINDIQSATSDTVNAMQSIMANISDIDESVTGISAAVDEQNATTSEILRSVAEASRGAQNTSQIMVEVQRNVGETGESVETLIEVSGDVSKVSRNLKGAVDGFLTQIRSS